MDDDAFTPDPEIPDSPDKEAVKKQLQEELAKYEKAFEEEWATEKAYEDGKLTPIEIRRRTKELLTQATPKAVASMLHLSQHARSEQVRMAAAKFILEASIGKESGGLVGDPMLELMEGLDAKAKTESAP